LVESKLVKLRGIHIKSTANDSPSLIFIPEIFDQAESWLDFFSNPLNKVASTTFRSFIKEMFTFSILATLALRIDVTSSDGKTWLVVVNSFRGRR